MPLATPLSHDEAHRLYWETSAPVAGVAKKHGLKTAQLAKLAGPIDIGVRCSGCGMAVLAKSRSDRDSMLRAIENEQTDRGGGWKRYPSWSLMCYDCYRVERKRSDELNQHVEMTVVVTAMRMAIAPRLGGDDDSWLDDDDNHARATDAAIEILAYLEERDVDVHLAVRLEHPGMKEVVVDLLAQSSAPDALPEGVA